MAATIDFSLIREPHLLDLIDEEWAAERLPDDDIPLPATVQLLPDVEEEQKAKEPEKWHELGLQSVG
ncbi:hypothetical protein CHLNCDRAFT_136648 [Chlorella variabilis]|uniref:Anaphase-promoting complex subunit 13 n=1 Tax=Chlorella variabilis TaxID=554065 RepID=E1ZKR7_CHLVA|nr:hypothetical protein CHLNCDRAFT_136648 [Chlorella variabilis]EFN53427.1 hypothetical protein CHLNCDRAFT_136648 [Chlorella variabilis]|eukprot:XP_005845529.1 hypothetical protein CHLNCDRAFT_136648 [Chlorella variabilis]